MIREKMMNEDDLAFVSGGITQDEFYRGDYLKSGCTTCGNPDITTEDGIEADGRVYTIVKCASCGGVFRTYFDGAPRKSPV